jgi:hypothetical protein
VNIQDRNGFVVSYQVEQLIAALKRLRELQQ